MSIVLMHISLSSVYFNVVVVFLVMWFRTVVRFIFNP